MYKNMKVNKITANNVYILCLDLVSGLHNGFYARKFYNIIYLQYIIIDVAV